jgi:hypothetical protein
VVISALTVAMVAGPCLEAANSRALTAQVRLGGSIAPRADTWVKKSADNLLLSSIVAKVTEADVKSRGREDE